MANRVETGHQAQMSVVDLLINEHQATLKTVANIGSNKVDICVIKNEQELNFEVKKPSKKWVSILEKTSRRRKATDIFDDIVAEVTFEEHLSLSSLIEKCRQTDTKIGYPGDVGVIKSGKLPKFNLTNHLEYVRSTIRRWLISNNIHYLVLVDDSIRIFNVSDPLGIITTDTIPPIIKARIDTYGASKDGAMRVVLKVQFG